MKLGLYYTLYKYFKTGKVVCWGINIARFLGIRHLLVRMDTNFICNLRCKTCFFSAPNAKDMFISPMKLDLFKQIANDIFPKTRILFLSCGAEPLMTKNFDQFLEVSAKYSVPYIGYATNGLLLTNSIIKSSIESKVSEITISIDGATKDTYEYIRTRGNFDTLLNNLSMYKDIVSKVKGPTPSLRFNFTVTRTNHREMPILVDLAKQFGIDHIKIRIYMDWGGVLSYEEESLIGYEESFNKSLYEAKRKASEADIEIFAPKEFSIGNMVEADNNKKSTVVENKIYQPPCIHPWFYRYINPLGQVRVCACLPLSENRLNGNYNHREFTNSKEEVMRRYLLSKDPAESCFNKVCNGFYLRRANDDVNFLKDNPT